MSHLYTLMYLGIQECVEIDQPSVLLGRDGQCDVVIDSEESSRRHARLEVSDGRLMLQDLDSTNGTFVNNNRILEPVEVAGGDTIRIGDQALLVITPDGGANRTVIDGRLDGDLSYVLEKSSPEATSIRKVFPTPPGWTIGDKERLGRGGDADDEQEMDQRLAREKGRNAIAALLVTSGAEPRPMYLLPKSGNKGEWILGREDDCDIVLDDVTTSGHHARLVLAKGVWTIEDNQSRNGVKINGVRRKKKVLRRGDRISLGLVDLLFRPL